MFVYADAQGTQRQRIKTEKEGSEDCGVDEQSLGVRQEQNMLHR